MLKFIHPKASKLNLRFDDLRRVLIYVNKEIMAFLYIKNKLNICV